MRLKCLLLGMLAASFLLGLPVGQAANEADFERIELSVYASNTASQALYRTVGFVEEGVKKRGRKLDGVYEDVIIMAKLLKNSA